VIRPGPNWREYELSIFSQFEFEIKRWNREPKSHWVLGSG
jgi:hypothetical protein